MTDLNKAIYEVLTNQYKKDAKEAHQTVEQAGYRIYKHDGYFGVANDDTDRRIIIIRNWGLRLWWSGRDCFDGMPFNSFFELRKFDFENCLNKRINTEWRMVVNTRTYGFGNQFKAKKEKLNSARWRVGYYSKDIEETMKQIEKLQKDLVCYAEYKCQAEMELRELKKEYGLVK